MTNDYLKDLDDWDEQSQQILLSLAKNDEFISFEELEKGILRKAKNQLNSIKTNQSFQEISNQIALESLFGKNSLIYKPTIEDYDDLNKEFYTDSIDYELLANDLRNNLLKSTNFLFDYQKYKKDSLTISHSNTLGIPIVHEIKDNSSDLYFETGMLNKRKNLLSNRSKYYFGIYSHHDKIIYNLNFIYKDGENINFRKVENKISEELTDYVVNDEYIAIKLYTKNSDVYLKFLETIYGSEDREYMKNKIILYYKDFITNGKNNADILDSLYESIPDFVLEKLSDEELWNDLVTLSTASINRVVTDENVSIINLLGGIKNYTWWYNKINVNANVVQRLLENFSKQYRDQLIQIFSTIGIHNWTNKELEKAWKFDIDYERVEVDYKETIYYTGYAYYIEEKNKYDVGTAIFLYENFSPNRKSEIKDTLGLHSPFDVVKIPLEKNNYLYVPCFVAEYFTNKKIDEEFWDALNNIALVMLPEIGAAIAKGTAILSRIFNGRKIKTVEELIEFLGKVDQNVMAEDLEKVGIEALFRGTTRSTKGELFVGNINSIEYGASTSTDPIRAVIFGIESSSKQGTKGVLQIYIPKDLKGLNLQSANYRFEKELEIIINTSPENLSNFAIKEIPIEDARKLVEEVYGVSLDTRITSQDYSRYILENTKKLTPKEALDFYKKAIKLK